MNLISTRQFDTNELLTSLLEKFESCYLQLRSGAVDELTVQYSSNLYWMGEERIFRVNGEEVKGVIEGVDNAGRLLVKHGEKIQSYDLKEISFVQ